MGMGIQRIEESLYIDASPQEVWDFVSDPSNLKLITPPSMGFEIRTADLPDKIYPGLMIRYRVRPFAGIPTNWLTEITHVRELEYFVDEQRSGPYSLWHHEHHIQAEGNGTRMRDIVTYRLPLGILGDLARILFVRKRLGQIFSYRRNKLEQIFPSHGS